MGFCTLWMHLGWLVSGLMLLVLWQEGASEQAVSTCSLALAMLASFSRVPELASSQDLLEKIPLLVKARTHRVLSCHDRLASGS